MQQNYAGAVTLAQKGANLAQDVWSVARAPNVQTTLQGCAGAVNLQLKAAKSAQVVWSEREHTVRKDATKQKLLREANRARGLCCCGRPTVPDRKQCIKCLGYKDAQRRESRAATAARRLARVVAPKVIPEGLCRCGAPSAPERKSCVGCLLDREGRRLASAETLRAKRAAARVALRAAGRCGHCGLPSERYCCSLCAERLNDYVRRFRVKCRAEGTCYQCRAALPADSATALCFQCRRIRSIKRRRS